MCKQTGLPEGKILPFPLVEFYLKNDQLGDPLITSDRILALEIATKAQIEELKALARKINEHLSQFFEGCDIILVDFKLEFGLDGQNRVLLADEISPDTCRLWDKGENDPQARVMDKDRFRRDLGNIEAAYQAVQQRVLAKLGKL